MLSTFHWFCHVSKNLNSSLFVIESHGFDDTGSKQPNMYRTEVVFNASYLSQLQQFK